MASRSWRNRLSVCLEAAQVKQQAKKQELTVASINQVILLGNLGADPEIRYTQDGRATASIRLATSERYKDKAGETQEKTEWHRVVFFGKPAELVGQHCKKGEALFVQGRISTRKWQDKAGNDRYTTEIIGSSFQFVGGKSPAREGDGGGEAASAAPAKAPASGGHFDDMDDDIPF